MKSAESGPAESHGIRQHGLEHRLQIPGRAGDDLQNVGGGCLPLQRLAQLVEEPRVLDGNHGLIGETLLESELIVRERQESITKNDESPDCLAPATERRATDGAGAPRAGMRQAWKVRH